MANDFSGSNACALWKFDNDATDSVGGNDLNEANTPGYDSNNKQEGTHSADLNGTNEYFSIADASLDAGFPGSNGESEMDFSVCGWICPDSLDDVEEIIWKYNTSWQVSYDSADDKLYFSIYSTEWTTVKFGTALGSIDGSHWYHFGATYTASNNAMKLRIWDDTAGALLGVNATGTATSNHITSTGSLYIGAGTGYVDGHLDEVVVFAGEALSDSDIDKIRAGTYGAAAGVAPTAAFYGPLVGPLGGPI